MKFSNKVEPHRQLFGDMGSRPGDSFGAFEIPGPCGRTLRVIASDGDPSIGVTWEHVSVSLSNRCPNWPEMCFIKDLFWDEEDTVMQLHPPKSQWISNHPHCLHLWRPTQESIPLPPSITVGLKEAGELKTVKEAKALRDRFTSEVASPWQSGSVITK